MTNVYGTAWMLDGACRNLDPAVFFPSDGVGVALARAICKRCPVRSACLDYAMTHHIDHGVWGGESERSRIRLARRRLQEGAGAPSPSRDDQHLGQVGTKRSVGR